MRYFTVFALTIAAATLADAGPFHRRGSVAVCTTGTSQQTTAKPAAKPAGDTSSAQGVAILIVSTGRFRQFGGYNGYEGIGMGATQAQAEANCCFRNRLLPRERGFAQMASGLWVCVCRY
jgi:hypothetical protein